jgi:hypothetical protein
MEYAETTQKDGECTFLGMRIRFEKGMLRIGVMDKRDSFPFPVLRYPSAFSNIPFHQPGGVFQGQLVRYGLICNNMEDFREAVKRLTLRMMERGHRFGVLVRAWSAYMHHRWELNELKTYRLRTWFHRMGVWCLHHQGAEGTTRVPHIPRGAGGRRMPGTEPRSLGGTSAFPERAGARQSMQVADEDVGGGNGGDGSTILVMATQEGGDGDSENAGAEGAQEVGDGAMMVVRQTQEVLEEEEAAAGAEGDDGGAHARLAVGEEEAAVGAEGDDGGAQAQMVVVEEEEEAAAGAEGGDGGAQAQMVVEEEEAATGAEGDDGGVPAPLSPHSTPTHNRNHAGDGFYSEGEEEIRDEEIPLGKITREAAGAASLVVCPFCGRSFRPKGLGPHKAACPQNPKRMNTRSPRKK